MTDTNSYHFVTNWHVEGTCEEISEILDDPCELPRWWPAVYLRVDEISPAGTKGVGRRVRFSTRGWLPYTLAWESLVTESRRPFGFTIEASGDFVGWGVWTFTQRGPLVDIMYDWKIRAEKPLLRRLSFLLKPVFEANHRWAMAQGEASLKLELARRRSRGDAGARVPLPPGPVTYAGIVLVGSAAFVVGTLAYLMTRARRRRASS